MKKELNFMIKKGCLPSISVNTMTLPEAYERAILEVWDKGAEVHTHYDRKDKEGNYIDPPSREATVMINVENPFAEPRIHKNFPGGPSELEVYRQEVVEGIHDSWIEPDSTKWTYTYHERLFGYNVSEDLNSKGDRGILISRKKLKDLIYQDNSNDKIREAYEKGTLSIDPKNQIDKIIEDLKKDITSKGAQATTWMPTADPGLESNRPCLQRIWFRPLLADIDGKEGYLLNMNTHWRSRDLYKAWFMNAYALTDLQRKVADMLEKEIKVPVKVGNYIDICDSLHLYGAYIDERTDEGKKFFREIDKMKNTPLENRVMRSDDEAFLEMTLETRKRLEENPNFMIS